MFGIFKSIFGGRKVAGRDKDLTVIRDTADTDRNDADSERRRRFGNFEREMRERSEAQSHEMPGQAYFSQLQALQESISERRYSDAAAAARTSLSLIRKWLEDPRGDGKRLNLSIPALTQGGNMLAITGDRKGLEMLHDLVSEFDHLKEYRADAKKHLAAVDLFDDIRKVIATKPGILQNKVKAEVGVEDGRLVSNLISWLEKAGEIIRAKNGKTYALYLHGVEMSAKDASAVYREPPRPGSHQARSNPGKPVELSLDKLTLVPLPPSPQTWGSEVALPATSETFEDTDGAWREFSVEAIAPADRPDPAFRKHFTTHGGILSFDDLAKSEASFGAPGAVLFTSDKGGTLIIEQLKRPIYAHNVHPEGEGFATRSKTNILTVYGADLKVDFETDLSATPEIAAGRSRLDLEGEGGILWGEPHLAINCIALSPSRDRYLYTHVDEAWCIGRDGKRLWGVRMPERPVETYHHTFEEGDIGGHQGTAVEIESALKELELALPVTPDDIRQKYRDMVRQLHPDLNPGNEERMKAVNAAYEMLTGASHDDLNGRGSAEDLLKFSATVTFTTGGGPDRLQAAIFSGSGDTVLLGTSQGRVLRIDGSGKPIALYDVGAAPVRILETDRYLYIQTFARLYVLEGDRLVGLQDCTTKCDLLVEEGLILLVENKGVRVLTEGGRPLGVALTKAPIRRAGIKDGVLIVETRTHRGRFRGLMG
ncbi:MAG: hypothetical protein ACI9LZ_000733 [Glaciecola sp.]